MPPKIFQIQIVNGFGSFRVKNSAGLHYDASSDSFKPLPQVARPLIPLTPGAKGTVEATDSLYDLPLTAAFANDTYTVIYHDANGIGVGGLNFTVYNGDFVPPTPDAIAARVANVAVNGGKTSLRDAVTDLETRVTALAATAAQILALVQPKAQ